MINNVLFKIVLNFKDIKLILNLFRQKSAILLGMTRVLTIEKVRNFGL